MGQRLDGNVAIVTGAGRGLGRAIARVFAAEGARVLTVDKDSESCARTAEAIVSAGGIASAVRGDVTRWPDMQAMAQAAIERYGRIDVLCQNAGVYPAVQLQNMTEQDWDRVHAINLKSLFFAVKACLPQMMQQRSGRICVTSSITGPRTGIPGLTHYAATKAGINGFVRSAALELAPYNIRINGVEPGTVLTEGLRELMTPDEIDALAQSIPLKKLADPEDIAYAMLFLASDEAKYITGQTIVVDGGQILPESKFALV